MTLTDITVIIETVPNPYRQIFLDGYGKKLDISKTKSYDGGRTSTYQNTSKPITQSNQTSQSKVKLNVSKGDEVKHKSFGVGTVKKFSGEYIIISFGGEDHQFQYPAAFLKGYLSK